MIEIRHLRDSPIETTPIYHIYIIYIYTYVYTLVNTLLRGINFKPCFYLVSVKLLAPNPYMIAVGLEAQYKHTVFVVWWCECSESALGLVLGDGVVERLVEWGACCEAWWWVGGLGWGPLMWWLGGGGQGLGGDRGLGGGPEGWCGSAQLGVATGGGAGAGLGLGLGPKIFKFLECFKFFKF